MFSMLIFLVFFSILLAKIVPNDENKVRTDRFLLGKDNAGKSGSTYGAAVYDELEFWEGPRDYLLAFGYIQRGSLCSYVKMQYKVYKSF